MTRVQAERKLANLLGHIQAKWVAEKIDMVSLRDDRRIERLRRILERSETK
jgi:hypothetical protein